MYKYDDPKDIQYQVRNLTSTVNLLVQPGFGEIFGELLCQSKGGWNAWLVSLFRDHVLMTEMKSILWVKFRNCSKRRMQCFF